MNWIQRFLTAIATHKVALSVHSITRTASLVVAANDSSTKSKAQADYVCTGTDDHLKIQEAIDALPATGGEVKLLDGTYNIEASLVLDSYQTLRGCGRNTILTTTTVGVDIITATGGAGSEKVGILIADLCVDGNAGGVDNDIGIIWTYVDHSKIVGVWVLDNYNEGLELDYCDFNNIIGNTIQRTGGDAIWLVNSNGNIISNNIVQGNLWGIYLNDSNNNTIAGNICQGNTEDSLTLNDGDNNTISGNTCNENGWGVNLTGGKSNTVIGNTCNWNGQRGIVILGPNDNNTIVGNTCVGNSQQADNLYANITVDDSSYNLITNNFCRAPTIGTTLTTGESAGATDIHVTTTTGFEVGMGVVIDLGGGSVEYHRISAITAGTPGIITIDTGLTNDQGVGETINVPEAKYGIDLVGVGSENNVVKNNDLYDSGKTANLNDAGTGTKLPSITVPFSDGTEATDSGFLIDADTDYARAWLFLPLEVVQVVRIKVYARSAVLEADKMMGEFIIYGGADNEPYTTHGGQIGLLPSTSADFAADDIIYWTNETLVQAMLGGDSVEVKVRHEAAGDGHCETNAYFRTVTIEYV